MNQSEASTIPTKIFKNAQWISKSQSVNKRKSPNYPCRRWGHTAVLHDKYMYVFSGCGKSDNQRQWEQVYRMDCLTFQWERINSPSLKHPSGRDSHSCVCMLNKLYFFGGSSNDLIMGDFWSFDLETYDWVELGVPKEFQAREGHSMVPLTQRLIYIYGGWDSVQNLMTDSHWLYDIQTNKFQRIIHTTGEELMKLESHSANKIGESVYIFGGQGQATGKTQIFYKDLYKLDFENLNDINDEEEDKEHENTIIKIEKIKSNGPQIPTPRASHSAVAYADRFLFIIGGEGYQYDQIKDNEEDIMEPEQDDAQNIDEEEKPIYPKNDIWIFETVMKTWSKLTPKCKSPVFQPRFSHSCVVFKDQLIIFGGLRSMGEVLEDIMVLHLKDSENHLQKFSREEMKNVCKYCHLIYGIQQEEEISFHKIADNNAIKQPRLSLAFVDEISKLINCPMASFALFLDNAKLSEASELKIEYVQLQRRKKYANTVEEIQDKTPAIIIFEQNPTEMDDLSDFLFNFDLPKKKYCLNRQDWEQICRNGGESLIIEEQNQFNRKQYALNFKIAALRLGDSALICHKQGNSYNVGLISMNNQLNPNDENLTFYNYVLTMNGDKERKVDCPESKHVLLNAITHLFSEEDFILNQTGNYTKIIVFDLQRVHDKQKLYELNLYNDDILSAAYAAFDLKKDDALKYPDYSLKEYIKCYSLESLPYKLFLQDQLMNGPCSIKSKLEPKYKVQLNDEKLITKLNECTESYALCRLPTQNFGIFLYFQGRLINRYKKPFGIMPGQMEISGYLNLCKFLLPNMTQEGFQNQYLSSILYQLIENLEQECEPEVRKEVKII